MIENLEFIEQLKNIKELVLTSPYARSERHVLKYIDILINLRQKEFDEFERGNEAMRESEEWIFEKYGMTEGRRL
tara:strand:- start:305 stop:529 length:225 start_codon:yes stop_codon:yes gene_type:complete